MEQHKFIGLTGNQLKIIALIAMTCDHVGKQLLPQYMWLQIIGRLTFPLFAYMIAEGCRYTKNRKKYLITIAVVAILCQLAYYIAMGSLYQCVLVTFSLSIGLIYVLDYALKKKSFFAWTMTGIAIISVCFITELLPRILLNTDFRIDYDIWGVLLPVFVYIGNTKSQKILFATAGLILLAASIGGIQWYAFASLPLLAMYSGERGSWNMKYVFYVYYPLHLVVIYAISVVW